MGWADLGCYGSTDIRTPHVDRLAGQGVRLTHFYSNGPVCTPTRCALMTGRWQQRVGLEWAIGVTSQPQRRVGDTWVVEKDYKLAGLDPRETSLARIAGRRGEGSTARGSTARRRGKDVPPHGSRRSAGEHIAYRQVD